VSKEIQIETSWKEILKDEFEQPYFDSIRTFIVNEIKKGKTIYPPGSLIFNAFNSTPFQEVKVVIIGQDPYHGHGQAMGLCFSVPKGIPYPPSLKNIFAELKNDLGIPVPQHGDLTSWTQQGVFLLNAILTVEKGKAGSHSKIGWQTFTDAVIRKLSDKRNGLVFLLWGNYARGKKTLIDEMKHYVLESSHPSPLAGGGFFDNHHFSRTNEILLKQGLSPPDWRL